MAGAQPARRHPDAPGQLYRVDLDEVPYPVTLLTADFVNVISTKDKIKFDMHGTPTSDGLALVSGTIVVQSGSEQKTVTVDPITGKATVL